MAARKYAPPRTWVRPDGQWPEGPFAADAPPYAVVTAAVVVAYRAAAGSRSLRSVARGRARAGARHGPVAGLPARLNRYFATTVTLMSHVLPSGLVTVMTALPGASALAPGLKTALPS